MFLVAVDNSTVREVGETSQSLTSCIVQLIEHVYGEEALLDYTVRDADEHMSEYSRVTADLINASEYVSTHIFDLIIISRHLDEPTLVLAPMKELVLACKFITRDTLRLEESLPAEDRSLSSMLSGLSHALGELTERVKSHALDLSSSSAPIRDASKHLTSAVFALLGEFNTEENRRNNVLVINDELLTAYENAIASVLQSIWFVVVFSLIFCVCLGEMIQDARSF